MVRNPSPQNNPAPPHRQTLMVSVERQRLAANMVAVSNAFLAVRQLARSTFSRMFIGTSRALDAIERGANFEIGTYDRYMEMVSAAWPEGAVWPSHVQRPSVLAAAKAKRLKEAAQEDGAETSS